MVELMALVETGTRAVIGAVFGSTREGETAYARQLPHLLRPDMLFLWDKGFDANAFPAAMVDTSAQLLGRLRANRRTPVLTRLSDGSYLSVIGTVPVASAPARSNRPSRATTNASTTAARTPAALSPASTSSSSNPATAARAAHRVPRPKHRPYTAP
jgi:hypothetical protein